MGTTLVHLRDDDPPAQGLTFVTAIAVHRSILAFADRGDDGATLILKWPNDVMFGAAKVAGILLERRGNYVAIGVGVNLVSAPAIAGRQTASLSDIGIAIGRDDFAHMLVEQMENGVKHWRSGAWPDGVLHDWMAIAHPLGTILTLTDGDHAGLTASFDGLEHDGRLRLRLAGGQTLLVSAGDVQVSQG